MAEDPKTDKIAIAPTTRTNTYAMPPLSCADAWKEADGEADKIINSSNDPIVRNRNINAAYAKLYLEDNRLHWPGVAAFASKQVGCGLTAAKQTARDGLTAMPLSPIVGGGVAASSAIVYNALATGNKEVFKDIYPVHRFYQKNGIEGLRKCAEERHPHVDKKVMEGFEAIDKGDYDGGAKSILLHEQLDILQSPKIFDDWKLQKIMGINQAAVKHGVGGPFQATTTAFTATCKGEPTVTFEGDNPANFKERWPFAQKVVGKFSDIINSGDPGQIKSVTDQLKIIAAGKSGG